MKSMAWMACAAMAALLAVADTVWLDEPGVWERMSGGHGRSWLCTNGQNMVMGRYSRGVGTCAPSALYLAMNGNAISFDATVGQLNGRNKSKLTFRVYRENELAFESPVLDSEPGPQKVHADLSGARWVKLEAHGVERPYSGTSIWADARFEMKPGTRPQDIASLTPQLGALTPVPSKAPRINGPRVYGVRPGHPIFYRLPVTGAKPIVASDTWSLGVLKNSESRIFFDPETRILTGAIDKPGEYKITFTAENSEGRACRDLTVKVG